MVVDIINIKRVRVDKTENYTPVCSNRYRPKAAEPAFQRMEPKTGNIHVGYVPECIEPRQNIAQLFNMLCQSAPRFFVFVKSFQPLVAYGADYLKP